jgi:hypothetical protein
MRCGPGGPGWHRRCGVAEAFVPVHARGCADRAQPLARGYKARKLTPPAVADNPAAAARVVEGIYDKVQLLRSFPDTGCRHSQVEEGEARVLVYGHYPIAPRAGGCCQARTDPNFTNFTISCHWLADRGGARGTAASRNTCAGAFESTGRRRARADSSPKCRSSSSSLAGTGPQRLTANFRNQKGIMSLDRTVRRAEGYPPRRAVGCQQPVERIVRP